jgi:hypothetical protein
MQKNYKARFKRARLVFHTAVPTKITYKILKNLPKWLCKKHPKYKKYITAPPTNVSKVALRHKGNVISPGGYRYLPEGEM